MTGRLVLEIVIYSLALWLGLYLLARNPANPRLRYAGLGIIAYGLSLITDFLSAFAPGSDLALFLARLHWPLLFLPAFFWFMAASHLVPAQSSWQERLAHRGAQALLLVAVPVYLLSAGTTLIFNFTINPPQAGPLYPVFAGLVLIPLLIALLLIGHAARRAPSRKLLGLLLLATVFLGLSLGLLLFPLNWLPQMWLLLAMSADFVVLGLVIALLDAFEEGESLLPDMARSFDLSFFHVLLFGGLVSLVIVFGTGPTLPMLLLLLGIVTAAIAVQVFSDPIQSAVDRLAFAAFPHLRQERANLRAAASTMARFQEAFDPGGLDEDKFVRLTRRALSHMGDLPRLAANPLTRLGLVETRLARRGARDDTLARAAELKDLLTESILRLKPRDKGDFGTTEEWRHYNALYFPYVAGLKPYSRRTDYAGNGLDSVEKAALDWFRTYVPERTLYNWQNAAAKLVAQDLIEQVETGTQR